jgi:glycerol-3-phosphate dehydrogenase
MAEDVMEIAMHKAGLPEKECITKTLHIHGHKEILDYNEPLYYYGTDKEKIKTLIEMDNILAEPIHPSLPFIKAEIIWAVQNEMCMTLEDALSRRTRALLLDTRAATASASVVAQLMAKEMNKDNFWVTQQIEDFNKIAKHYLPSSN